jgi:protein CpxP
MKMTKLLSASVILLTAASVTPVMAGGAGEDCDVKHHNSHWGGGGEFRGPDVRHFGRALDLTDDQKATLKTQQEATRAEREQRHTKLREARQALTAAVNAGANDAELAVLAEALGKVKAEQELSAIKAHQAFIAVLTDEQKAKLAERSSKRFERKMEDKPERHQPKSS